MMPLCRAIIEKSLGKARIEKKKFKLGLNMTGVFAQDESTETRVYLPGGQGRLTGQTVWTILRYLICIDVIPSGVYAELIC